MTRRRVIGLSVAAIAVVLGLLLWLAAGGSDVSPRQKLTIRTQSGQEHVFRIEVADTPEQKAYGLMFRRVLEPDAGMLFPFTPPQDVRMWMKNTLIPLDMLFTDEAGVITKIHENAVPESLERIEGGVVAAVLELPGGTAGRLGLGPGDVMEHPFFRR